MKENLTMLLLGGALLALGIDLFLSREPTRAGLLPLWSYLLAGGSILLSGGFLAMVVGDVWGWNPGPAEGGSGDDLVSVPRAEWEAWRRTQAGRRSDRAPAPAAPSPPARTAAAAELPPWNEEIPVPARGAGTAAAPEARARAAEGAPAPAAAAARPPAPRPPEPRRGGAPEAAPAPPADDIDALLAEFELEAHRGRPSTPLSKPPDERSELACASCGRAIGLTAGWETCENCFASYCEVCAARIGPMRSGCPACSSARPGTPV
ncbi:MAG TPA: hypothetical protein VMH78_08050 [Thermoplasmata archaeon]|nr:hypothetical protein [Thermoplasmata archaeon]